MTESKQGTATRGAGGLSSKGLQAGKVGAFAGAVIGDVSEDALTPETQTYVLEHKTESVVLDGNVAVGTAIPETVQIQTIPDGQYGYVYVQDRPVLVDPQNRQIIHIYE